MKKIFDHVFVFLYSKYEEFGNKWVEGKESILFTSYSYVEYKQLENIFIKDVVFWRKQRLESMWGMIARELPGTHETDVKQIWREEEAEIKMEVCRFNDQVNKHVAISCMYQGIVVSFWSELK